jgi:hypothetical protein
VRNITLPFTVVTAWFGLHGVAHATVHIHIDLDDQRMQVDSDSGAHYEWPISSGRPGHETPTGAFRPQRMFVMVHSAKYDDAPMPHAIFFHGPYAIHGTGSVRALGHVASHGCVRLAPGHAATLFALVEKEGATITIDRTPAGTGEVAAANPHRAGHRLAAAQRHRFQQNALGYAPRRASVGLWDWARNPLRLY